MTDEPRIEYVEEHCGLLDAPTAPHPHIGVVVLMGAPSRAPANGRPVARPVRLGVRCGPAEIRDLVIVIDDDDNPDGRRREHYALIANRMMQDLTN